MLIFIFLETGWHKQALYTSLLIHLFALSIWSPIHDLSVNTKPTLNDLYFICKTNMYKNRNQCKNKEKTSLSYSLWTEKKHKRHKKITCIFSRQLHECTFHSIEEEIIKCFNLYNTSREYKFNWNNSSDCTWFLKNIKNFITKYKIISNFEITT